MGENFRAISKFRMLGLNFPLKSRLQNAEYDTIGLLEYLRIGICNNLNSFDLNFMKLCHIL